MVNSDHSETEEGDMDRLQLSSDSIDAISSKKRLRVEDSEDETDLPAKKRQSSFSEWSKMLENDNAKISDKNNIDERDVKEERRTFSGLSPKNEENVQEESLSESDVDKKNKDLRDGRLKEENKSKSAQDENSITLTKSPDKTEEEIAENMVI